jgi:CitMHS family citrate-Mg2+:H+ or citrate-Ca2+:H+ symporter
MLALFGLVTIVLFLIGTISRKISVLAALVLIPVITALMAGAGGEIGEYMLAGMQKTAPVGILLLFAILYFSLMLDVGLFDPLVKVILKVVGHDPVKISVGTAVLTTLIALDGDGSSTYLIVCAAMLPVYLKVGMSRLSLAAVAALPVGYMNILPWGGPTARAVAALQSDVTTIFNPMIVPMIACAIWVIAASVLIGLGERRRINKALHTSRTEVTQLVGSSVGAAGHAAGADQTPNRATGVDDADEAETAVRIGRPHWAFKVFNALLTITLIVVLVAELMPPAVIFAVGFVLALVVNVPKWKVQQELFARHGAPVIMVVTLIFAAGSFAGILLGSGMVGAMAEVLGAAIPRELGGLLPVIVGLASMPLSLVLPPDAFYFGMLPVLAETYASMGGDPAVIGRAALLGHTTTGSPLSPLNASTFVLLSATGIDLIRHQKNLFKWAFGSTVVMTAAALLTGAITWTL